MEKLVFASKCLFSSCVLWRTVRDLLNLAGYVRARMLSVFGVCNVEELTDLLCNSLIVCIRVRSMNNTRFLHV